jgi:hypothetical protein
MVAEAAGWYGHKDVRARTFTEDHARDSFENLLFGLCRFYELTGGLAWGLWPVCGGRAGRAGKWVLT